MAGEPSPQDVAEAFAAQYYTILCRSPETLHKFFKESSIMGWQGVDGLMQHVTTFEGMSTIVSSTDYKNCTVKLQTVDCQKSQHGAIFVMVTGSFTLPNDDRKNFVQAFFLSRQEKGYFVSNDMLRVYDSHGTKPDYKNDHPAAATNSDKNVNVVLEKDIKEVVDYSVSKPLDTESAASGPPIDSPVPVERSFDDSTSLSTPDTKQVLQYEMDFPKIAIPASNEDVDAKTLTVIPNVSYASVLTREGVMTSPTAKIALDVQTQPTASLRAKKPESSEKRVPKSPQARNGSVRAEGIYIGGLPYDVTKQDIAAALNHFGAIKRHSDAIQIRKHEDGFVCAFVDFESADASHLAVKAHHVRLCNKVAYISYKRSPSFQGKESGKNVATRVANQNGDKSGDDKTNCQAKVPRRTHRNANNGRALVSLEATGSSDAAVEGKPIP